MPARSPVLRLGAAVRAISAPCAMPFGAPAALAAHLARAAELLGLPQELDGIVVRLGAVPAKIEGALAAALADELPLNKRDGAFIRDRFDADLDEHRKLRDGSRQVIAGLQSAYAQSTGIKSLKVRHNNVLGYFVEVTASNAGALTSPPHAETFVHRQTLANVMRFSTLELAELEARITTAADRALALELDIFGRLAEAILAEQSALAAASASSRGARPLCGSRRACRRAGLRSPEDR